MHIFRFHGFVLRGFASYFVRVLGMVFGWSCVPGALLRHSYAPVQCISKMTDESTVNTHLVRHGAPLATLPRYGACGVHLWTFLILGYGAFVTITIDLPLYHPVLLVLMSGPFCGGKWIINCCQLVQCEGDVDRTKSYFDSSVVFLLLSGHLCCGVSFLPCPVHRLT